MMGRNHARILSSLDGVEFVGVCDPDVTLKTSNIGVPIFQSVAELIDTGIDYAVVSVPTIQHLTVGKELASAGVHALIEKPLSYDETSARELASAFKDLVGAVGHIERYNPALQQARKRLGEIGTLYQVVTRRQGPFPSRISDVGVVKDLASHDIDLTSWVTNQQFMNVSAQTSYRSGRNHEDMVIVVGRLSGGAISSHIVNWLSPLKERVTILTGENGSFVADTLTADLTYYANGKIPTNWDDIARFRGVAEGDVIRYAFPKPEPLRVEHENFRDAVLGIDSQIVTMEQGCKTAEIAEAILQSARDQISISVAK